MEGSFRIGSLFGIPIRIHFTFLIIIPLFAWIIGSDIGFTIEMVEKVFGITVDTSLIRTGYTPYILGIAISLGLFAGVFIHELAHSLVAKRAGIPIEHITLLFFGGVAAIDEQEPEPRVELIMALAGPLTSGAIGIICGVLLYALTLVQPTPVTGVLIYILGYLAILNVLLFAFNLLPAFPMDGGRVLRAYLASRMPLHRATGIASTIGKGFAVVFGLLGIIIFSPLLILIAFFIYIGAGQESTVIHYNFLLRDVMVGDIMSRPVTAIPQTMPVPEIISLMYRTKHLGFPVVDRSTLIGIVTLTDLSRTNAIDRDALQARDIMTRDVITLPPGSPVMDALRIMTSQDIGRIPIVQDGEILGIISKTDIFKVMELRER